MRRTTIALAAAAFLVALGCAADPGAETPSTDPLNVEASTAADPPAKPVSGQLKAGTWEVPGEVKPGTYTTTAEGPCYWARLKNFDGELSSILANGNLDPDQRGRLTVKKTDKGLELTGDCVWVRAK